MIIKDHLDTPDWPQKHHWEQTPEHPEGLWELFPPSCTKNLTAAEQERCRVGNAARLAQEDRWFRDPMMRKASNLVSDIQVSDRWMDE